MLSTYIISFNPYNHSLTKYYYLYFMDEKSEAQGY